MNESHLDPESPDFNPPTELRGFERWGDGAMSDAERSHRKRLMKAKLGLKELRGLWLAPEHHPGVKALAERFSGVRTIRADVPDVALWRDQRLQLAAEKLLNSFNSSPMLRFNPVVNKMFAELQAALDSHPPAA